MVNEGSDYAYFTVDTHQGQALRLNLKNNSFDNPVELGFDLQEGYADISTDEIEYYDKPTSQWKTYDRSLNAGYIIVNSNNELINGSADQLQVRIKIINDNSVLNQPVYEAKQFTEGLRLEVSSSGLSSNGATFIIDNGEGTIFTSNGDVQSERMLVPNDQYDQNWAVPVGSGRTIREIIINDPSGEEAFKTTSQFNKDGLNYDQASNQLTLKLNELLGEIKEGEYYISVVSSNQTTTESASSLFFDDDRGNRALSTSDITYKMYSTEKSLSKKLPGYDPDGDP